MCQAAYNEALDKHGSVTIDITQCIFVGPSAMGKSTLKHLLVHNTPKAVKTSTAVMEQPAVVTISSEQYILEGGSASAWRLVDKDVMGKSLRACINSKMYNEYEYPSHQYSQEQHEERSEERNPPHQPTSLNYIQTFLMSLSRVFHASTTHEAVSCHRDSGEDSQRAPTNDRCNSGSSEAVAMLDREHSSLMQDVRGVCESIKLNDAAFIHLLDTGGQPSFQDALPLLLDAPCTYIQVFNAAQDLDQPVPIIYRRDDHTEESLLSPSTETRWEMMLRSFSSMHTMTHKSSKELATFQQEKDQLPQLRIFDVGTFKDQLVEEGRLKEAVQDISKRLRELEGKPYYHCIQKDTAGQPFYIINNMADNEDDRADVNSLREHLSAARSSLKLKVPVMWYICKQITQGTSQKFFRFQDMKAFCLKQKFIDADGADEQFRSLLKLFSLLGFYAFFDLKDVPDEANYICTDKGMFLKEVSKLLAVQFLKAPKHHSVEVFKQNGIISNNAEMFEELGIIEEVDRSWFLAALEHVGLLAHYASATGHSTSYFMPVALPQGKMKRPDRSSVASLCVTFTFHSLDNPLVYTDLPRGVFCRLAVILSKGPWTPIPKESDRTTVKFYSEAFELFLTEAPGFICLTPVLVEDLEGKDPLAELHALCREFFGTLQKSIVTSAENVLGEQFHQTVKIVFGFECACGKVPHLATPASAKGKSLICQATNKRHLSLKQEQIWFSPVEGTEVSD